LRLLWELDCSWDFSQNGSNGDSWVKRCFNLNFIRFWTSFDVWKRLGKLWKPIWAWGIQNWDFGMKNEISRQNTVMVREASKLTRHSEQKCDREHALLATASRTTHHSEQRGDREGTLLATASWTTWEASCLSSSFSVLRFVSFLHFSVLNWLLI